MCIFVTHFRWNFTRFSSIYKCRSHNLINIQQGFWQLLLYIRISCKFIRFLTNQSIVCAFGVCVISINRAVTVWVPSEVKRLFSWKMSTLYFIMLWIFSIGFNLLPLTKTWGEIIYDEYTFRKSFQTTVKTLKDSF